MKNKEGADYMKMSKFYMPALKQEPNDADIISAKLLLLAGMIRKNVQEFIPSYRWGLEY